jgi:hypothetical protein
MHEKLYKEAVRLKEFLSQKGKAKPPCANFGKSAPTANAKPANANDGTGKIGSQRKT